MKFAQNRNAVSFSPSLGGGWGEAQGPERGFSMLIANRGEIACRIIRTARKLGFRTVAVYAPDDADSLHVSMADEAVVLVGDSLSETYLNQDKIIQIALDSKSNAIHPGYGFLSENAGFAQKVSNSGLIFIGPTPENIRLMGEKNQALAYAESIGIPILKSFRGTSSEILKHAPEIQFPMMVKASGGGGGKGMIICNSADELAFDLQNAERQALAYFGNGELFVEKYLPRARHIEVQLIGDHYGNVLHFFERECSVQRRFQKIIEEAPSPSVDENLRSSLTLAAVKIAKSMNYRNAGTIEFLLDENGHFYFLEMSTRIQVEHPVTEMVTGVDLIALQIDVAKGNRLELKQEDIKLQGHALELRLCAENAEHQFQPSAGNVSVWRFPENKNLRLETFVREGLVISPNYDSLLAKLIVWDSGRIQAIERMKQVLSEVAISGVHTNLPFLSGLIENDELVNNQIYTSFIDTNLMDINRRNNLRKDIIDRERLICGYLVFRLQEKEVSENSVWNQIGFWRINPRFEVFVDDEKFSGTVKKNGNIFLIRINENEYHILIGKKEPNHLELQINCEHESFYFVENKEETIVVSGNYSFAVRSNLFLNEITLKSKNESLGVIFQNLICADLFGRVLNLKITSGERVKSGQILLTLESMKTEIHVICPIDAKVKKVHVKPGYEVVEKQLLVELVPSDTPIVGEPEGNQEAD